jgi:hypothetical protein
MLSGSENNLLHMYAHFEAFMMKSRLSLLKLSVPLGGPGAIN